MAGRAKSEAGGSTALPVLIGVAGLTLLIGCVGGSVLGWMFRGQFGFGDAPAKEGARPGQDILPEEKLVVGKPGEKIVTDADVMAKKLLPAHKTEWEKLVGRQFELTGEVQMVAPGFFYIDGVQGIRFLCRPAPNFAEFVAKLPMGKRVKVEGKCVSAVPPDVHLGSCTITVLNPK